MEKLLLIADTNHFGYLKKKFHLNFMYWVSHKATLHISSKYQVRNLVGKIIETPR